MPANSVGLSKVIFVEGVVSMFIRRIGERPVVFLLAVLGERNIYQMVVGNM